MILTGDALAMLQTLPAGSVQMCVTSPPYWGLRDYGVAGQLGLEPSPAEYVARLVGIFDEVRRVLKDDGTLWLNLGDSYASSAKGSGGPSAKQDSNAGSRYDLKRYDLKPKDLVGIPWMVAFALRNAGWYLRSDIIWSKPNPMPESVTDRPTKAHEYIFLLSKSDRYFYDAEAIAEPVKSFGDGLPSPDKAARAGQTTNGTGASTLRTLRNRRTVWPMTPKPYRGAHFAVFPPELPRLCILAGSRPGDTVLDPFLGSGTTGAVAKELGRDFIGMELNPVYVKLAEQRTA